MERSDGHHFTQVVKLDWALIVRPTHDKMQHELHIVTYEVFLPKCLI